MGELNIKKENLNDFMDVCKKFQLLGLPDSGEGIFNLNETGKEGLESSELTNINENCINENAVFETNDVVIRSDDGEDRFEEVDANHKMFKSTRGSKRVKISYKCKSCCYISNTKHHMKYHIKSKHLNIRYPCGICDYSSLQPSGLKKHQKFKHEKLHPCACSACPYGKIVIDAPYKMEGLNRK